MKKIILLFLVLGITTGFAQLQVNGGKIVKLSKLYNEKDYEECFYKAQDMSEDEDLKNNPEVYLYMSICLYQISLLSDPALKEDFPNSYKESIKWAIKCKQKDKKKDIISQNTDYFLTLKNTGLETAKRLYNEKNYKYSLKSLKDIERLDPEDINVSYMRSVCDVLAGGNSNALEENGILLAKVKEKYNDSSFTPNELTKNILIDAFMIFSTHYIENNKIEEAQQLLSTALAIFPDNGFLKMQYNMIGKNSQK